MQVLTELGGPLLVLDRPQHRRQLRAVSGQRGDWLSLTLPRYPAAVGSGGRLGGARDAEQYVAGLALDLLEEPLGGHAAQGLADVPA